MASNLTVLCPNGRRQLIKVSPNTSILEVLEEACKKQGLKAENYEIKHYKKQLDLSLSVRFANLPNNALLELHPTGFTRSESVVTIALQLESGERLTGSFPPTSALSDILSTCLSSRNDIVKLDGNVEAVCIYMQQKFTGEEIKTTTLRSLGLMRGSASIRLMYRPLENVSSQAHICRPLSKSNSSSEAENNRNRRAETCPDEPDPVARKQQRLESNQPQAASQFNQNQTGSQFNQPQQWPEHVQTQQNLEQVQTQQNLEQNQLQQPGDNVEGTFELPFSVQPVNNNVQCFQEEPMQCDVAPEPSCKDMMSEEDNMMDSTVTTTTETVPLVQEIIIKEGIDNGEIGEIIYLGPRNAVLFNLRDILEIRKDDLSDEFFELTINDVRYLMDEYKRERHEMENAPLVTRSWREKQLLKELSCYKQSVIRIYFPDQLVLQGTFIANESVQSVIDFVKSFLEEEEELPFYLYTTPPKIVLDTRKTLLESRLVPASVLHFGCNTPKTNYLRADVRTRVSDPRAASHAAAKSRTKYMCSQEMIQDPCSSTSISMDDNAPMHMTASNGNANVANRAQFSEASAKIPAWFKLGKK